jgi:hypothetical protein
MAGRAPGSVTVVYVRWKDAQNSNASHSIAQLGDLAVLDEIGFLLKETDETLTIGTESPQQDLEARFWLTIPKAAIIEQRRTTLVKAFPKPRARKADLVGLDPA